MFFITTSGSGDAGLMKFGWKAGDLGSRTDIIERENGLWVSQETTAGLAAMWLFFAIISSSLSQHLLQPPSKPLPPALLRAIYMEVKGQKALTQDLIRIKSSLESLESALKSLQESTPQDPEEIQETEGRICTLCTTEAMNLLEKGEFTTSLSLLKRAESLSTVARVETLLEVLQLLSCYYGRLGKPIRALSYLDRAHEIEQSLPYYLSRGKTHLNYCAVLSQMNRHDDALQHALKAVMTLQDEVLCAAMRGQSISGARMEEMAVAYYNLAVEHEFKSEVSIHPVRRS